MLFKELREKTGEDKVAFREGRRYVARLVHSRKQKASAESLSLRSDGSYLITGGLGGLGLKVARWMVGQGVKYLVLLGRSGASDTARETVREMERADVKVVIAQADISQEKQVARVIAKIDHSMPPLRGIIHSAGVLDDGVLLNQDWERFTKVTAPKIAGAWNLHSQTLSMPLDFFVLFSSVISLIGSIGQGNYAAANAFLDTLAHQRRFQGLPALSINWGPWAEVGMAAGLSDRSQRRWTAQGMSLIEPEQGVQVLARLLGQVSAQIGVMSVKWLDFIEQHPIRDGRPFFSELIRGTCLQKKTSLETGKPTEFLLTLEEAPPEQRRALILAEAEQVLAEIWQEVIGIEKVEEDENFFDLGGDSVMAIQVAAKAVQVGLQLVPKHIFEHQTIAELAKVCRAMQDMPGYQDPVTEAGAAHQSRDAGGAAPSKANEFNYDQDDLDAIAQVIKKSIGGK
jgi:NAD(P)-dependent dehydrogenase (short-subunit alcohol dehydrogenase family)/aryl carrier-like protein